ncbi:hypothetical protein JKF63_05757 [Porcisia hertigi]|uniref:Uncharacterized protein n=1 Tax=Porcisia hertigi TaxID=2761500 RepID=A0A836IUT5_9TRYP|nr:hypothetical protein JKF63_05757 [Porcisia hertigi]
MPASSPGATGGVKSALLMDSVSLTRELSKNCASRRGSATSWLHPLSSTEVIDAVFPHNPLFPRHKQRTSSGEDTMMNGIATTGSLSLLSATETSPFQAQESRSCKSRSDSTSITSAGRRECRNYRGYMRLAGLLTRRGNKKSRKSLAPSGTASQTRSTGSGSQGTMMDDPHGTGLRNPLQPSDINGGACVITQELHFDDGESDWPSPSSPLAFPMSSERVCNVPSGTSSVSRRLSAANDTLPSRTRRDLSVSPLILPSSRTTQPAVLRRDDTGATHNAGLDTSGAQFVPLGSTYLGNRNGSPSRLQQSCDSGVYDEKVAGSVTLRMGPLRHRPVSGGSLSRSTSQSVGLIASTRSPQGQSPSRKAGDSQISQYTLMNPRSVRDAKMALLRASQQVSGCPLRGSRNHSFGRSHSNTSVCGLERMSHRATKTRSSSGEKRLERAVTGVLPGGGRDMSSHSMAVMDEEMMPISVALNCVCSSPTPSGMFSPPIASTQDPSSARLEQNMSIGEQRGRFNRADDNPLLEVMETSGCVSQGAYEVGHDTFWFPSVSHRVTRGHMDGASPPESPSQHSSSTRCGVFHPPRMPRGFYSLSRTGGYDSDSDGEEESRERERHRNRVDEVLRQLNGTIRSTTVDDKLVVTSVHHSSPGPSVRDAALRADVSQVENNCANGWGGGLVTSGGTTTTSGGYANMSTTVNTNGGGGWDGGGWLGVGGAVSSEEWYSRMRKKAEEDERAEAAAAAAAAATATAAAITVDATPTSSTSSGTLVPAHIPSVTITTHRRLSTRSETHMPAVDRTKEEKGPLSTTMSKIKPSSPSTKSTALSPKTLQSPQPVTSSAVVSTGEGFGQILRPNDTLRMQLSHTCAALSSTTDAKGDASAEDLPYSTPQPCVTPAAVSLNAEPYTEPPKFGCAPESGVAEPCLHHSGISTSAGCSSSTGGPPAALALARSSSKQPPENITPTPTPNSFASMPPIRHRQPNFQRRFLALEVSRTASNKAPVNPKSPGQPTLSGFFTSVSARIRDSKRLSLTSPNVAQVLPSATEATPMRDVSLPDVGANAHSSAPMEAQTRGELRRSPSAPAGLLKNPPIKRPPLGCVRPVDKSPPSSSGPSVIHSSTRLSL